jgi:hypothetical protein
VFGLEIDGNYLFYAQKDMCTVTFKGEMNGVSELNGCLTEMGENV